MPDERAGQRRAAQTIPSIASNRTTSCPHRIRCTACGVEVNAGCDCGAAYEALAAKKEASRRASSAYRERQKSQQEQRPRHMTRTIKLINRVVVIADQMTGVERKILFATLGQRFPDARHLLDGAA